MAQTPSRSAASPARLNRFFSFTYFQKAKDLRAGTGKGERRIETQIHKIRDGLALLELATVLNREGLSYGGPILNVPMSIQDKLRARVETQRIIRQEHLALRTGDVALLTTRPPLDDHDTPARRIIERSGSPLEREIFAGVRPFFSTCDRALMVIADEWQPRSNSIGAKKLRQVVFHQGQGAHVKEFSGDREYRKSGKVEAQLSLGYLLTVPPTGSRPYRIVAAFGIGGTETLWFCHLLRSLHDRRAPRAPWPTDLLRSALTSPHERLWTLPFLVPAYAPALLCCDLAELRPKRDFREVIEWVPAPSGRLI